MEKSMEKKKVPAPPSVRSVSRTYCFLMRKSKNFLSEKGNARKKSPPPKPKVHSEKDSSRKRDVSTNHHSEKQRSEQRSSPVSKHDLSSGSVSSTSKSAEHSSQLDIPDRSLSDFYCKACNSHMNSYNMWSAHIKGKRHIKRVKKDTSKSEDCVLERIVPNDSTLFIQDELDDIDEPVVGLNFMCERRRGQGSEPSYTCYLCDSQMSVSTVINHILSSKHRKFYLKHVDSDAYNVIMSLETSKRTTDDLVYQKVADCEMSNGRGQMEIKIENWRSGDKIKIKEENLKRSADSDEDTEEEEDSPRSKQKRVHPPIKQEPEYESDVKPPRKYKTEDTNNGMTSKVPKTEASMFSEEDDNSAKIQKLKMLSNKQIKISSPEDLDGIISTVCALSKALVVHKMDEDINFEGSREKFLKLFKSMRVLMQLEEVSPIEPFQRPQMNVPFESVSSPNFNYATRNSFPNMNRNYDFTGRNYGTESYGSNVSHVMPLPNGPYPPSQQQANHSAPNANMWSSQLYVPCQEQKEEVDVKPDLSKFPPMMGVIPELNIPPIISNENMIPVSQASDH